MAGDTAATPAYKVGDIVRFKKYEDLQGQPAIFTPGQQVRVTEIRTKDKGVREYVCMPVGGAGEGDTLFSDEFESLTPPEPEPATVAAPAPKKRGRPPKVKPADEAVTVTKGRETRTNKTARAKIVEAAVTANEPPKTRRSKRDRVAEAHAIVEAKGIPEIKQHTPSVEEALQQGDALETAKALVAQAEQTYFTLGGVLSYIWKNGDYKRRGYDGKAGFREYLEKDLGLKYRKGMYLIDIYASAVKAGIDERRLSQIGWSKAKELINVVTPENMNSLVDYAASHPREELIEHIRTIQVAAGVTPRQMIKKTKFTFSLVEDEAATAIRALDVAKTKVGTDADPSQVFYYILQEWLLFAEGQPGQVPAETEAPVESEGTTAAVARRA